MSEQYLWDRSGEPDADIARLEQVLGRLRAPDPLPRLTLPPGSSESAAPESAAPVSAAPVSAATEPHETPLQPVSPWAPRRLPWLSRQPAEAALLDAEDRVLSGRTTLAAGSSETRPASAGRWFVLPFAAAATLVVALGSVWLSMYPPGPRPSLEVSRLDGAPRVGSAPLGSETGRLPVGEWLDTDATARARIRVGQIGRVDVDPASRVGLLSTRPGNYRLRLERGVLHALIWASPGQFVVDTPAAAVIDLGCAYTLTVRDDGEAAVRVTSGWVALRDGGGREARVPPGALCAARPGRGPGTPHAADVSLAVAAALRTLDFERPSPATRAAALDTILAASRAKDAVMLWHLLSRVEPAERDRVFDRLAAFRPPPAGVTREAVREAATSELLDRWWSEGRLGPWPK